jgi:hypothetical protein
LGGTVPSYALSNTELRHCTVARDLTASFVLPQSSGHPDDGSSKHLWNSGRLLPGYTALHPRRQPSSYPPPWEPEMSPKKSHLPQMSQKKSHLPQMSPKKSHIYPQMSQRAGFYFISSPLTIHNNASVIITSQKKNLVIKQAWTTPVFLPPPSRRDFPLLFICPHRLMRLCLLGSELICVCTEKRRWTGEK